MANQFGHEGPVSGLKTQWQRQAEAEGYAVEGLSTTEHDITVQYHEATEDWTVKVGKGDGIHILRMTSSHQVKQWLNWFYEGSDEKRDVVWLDDEPVVHPEAAEGAEVASEPEKEPVARSAFAQVYPHAHGYEFRVSLYSDDKASNYIPRQDYTGTSHSLGDALVYVSNIIQARGLRLASIDVRTEGVVRTAVPATKPGAGEIVPGWTTEELLQREG